MIGSKINLKNVVLIANHFRCTIYLCKLCTRLEKVKAAVGRFLELQFSRPFLRYKTDLFIFLQNQKPTGKLMPSVVMSMYTRERGGGYA